MAAMTILIPQAIVLTSLVDTAFRVTGVEYRMKVNSAYSPRVVWILVQDVDIVTQKWCSSNELTEKARLPTRPEVAPDVPLSGRLGLVIKQKRRQVAALHMRLPSIDVSALVPRVIPKSESEIQINV